ncbi:hypothetical protein NTJ12_001515 [Flavobacterium psychrophilum]|nr:hypothetical protein [Flavobacterium psychrophilum]
MKLLGKKLDFIIIRHFLLKEFSLKEIVILEILWYLSKYNKNEFPESETYIYRLSGISRGTIRKAKEKFGRYGFAKCEDKKFYFLADFESRIEDLKEKFIFNLPSEVERDKAREKPTYTMYFFSIREKYNLSEIEYCFLDTHIGIFSKKEFEKSPKKYLEKTLGIHNTTYYEIRAKLIIKKIFIDCYKNSDFSKIDDKVIDVFIETKNCSKAEE